MPSFLPGGGWPGSDWNGGRHQLGTVAGIKSEYLAALRWNSQSLRMKPRETVQLAAVHVRIPEQLARGLRLMSVLEGRQAQVIVAKMLEEHLTKGNPGWRDTVPSRE